MEPNRWRGAYVKEHGGDHGAQDWQVTATGHLARERRWAAHL